MSCCWGKTTFVVSEVTGSIPAFNKKLVLRTLLIKIWLKRVVLVVKWLAELYCVWEVLGLIPAFFIMTWKTKIVWYQRTQKYEGKLTLTLLSVAIKDFNMNNSMGQKWLISNLGLNWKKTLRGSFVFWWAIGHFETRFRPFEMQQMKFFNSTMGSQATLSSSSMLWSDWLGNKGSKLINDRSRTQDDGGMGSNRVVSRQRNSIRLRSHYQVAFEGSAKVLIVLPQAS